MATENKNQNQKQPFDDSKGYNDVSEWYWSEIASALDENLANINDSYYFLLNVVESKKVCRDVNCPIWSKLSEIGKQRAFIRFPTLDAAKKVLTPQDFDNFEKNFNSHKSKILDLFNLIIQTATTRETKIYEEDIYHNRNIDMIRELLKSNQPIPIEVAKNLSSIMQMNSNLGESSEELKKHNEEMKRKDEEKKQKDSEKK